MKTLNYVSGVCLAFVTFMAGADADRASALSNCRDEAASTGLEQEADITAYVELCMQAWHTPDSYTDSDAPGEDNTEVVPEESAEAMPDENPLY